jgi:FAD/FMN-containing dehydrogenase
MARQQHVSMTFRAAGTNLSGQAQGDGILIDVRRHWTGGATYPNLSGGHVAQQDRPAWCFAPR